MRQSIAIVGVGAIGGSLAADLADLARHALVLCARRPFAKLVVEHPNGTSEVASPAVTNAAGLGPVDWLLLATKAHQSEGAKPWLDALVGPATRVAVAQNGVDHVERIAPLVAPGTAIVPVVVQLPCEQTAPGHVVQSRDGVLVVPDDAHGHAFAALFDGARTRVLPRTDFRAQAFSKLLANAALGGVCALVLRENAVAREPEIRAIVLAAMREIAEVARAEGVELPPDAPERALERVLAVAGEHWSSIVVDRREARPMEWEVRNAVVGRLGRRHGIATPWNDAITALLRAASARS